ncbi:MAG: transglutaminase-like domain-containing protein [Lachnospiraceae bacterium]|nr:transglutaminase-like domain-containing protein [Lachnospiraceae bacterium]
MTRILGFLSEKIPDRAKITALLSLELRALLFVFSLIMICIEAYQAVGGSTFPRGPFALTAILVFIFYGLLEYAFSLVVRGKAASFFPLLPTALLLLLLQKTDAPFFLSAAVASAVAARLFFNLAPHIEKVLLYGVFLPDAAAVYLYFGRHVLQGAYASDKLLFVSLVTLTLASLQELLFEKPLLRRSGEAFPFFYFALLGILVALLPMSQRPINWTPVAEAGGRIFHRAQNMVDSAAYHLSSMWGGSYTTGYNSLEVSGGKIEHSGRTEIILKTSQKPYYEYTDEETSEDMKVRRTLYLAGGAGVDKPKLISFLRFLHANDVDKEYASLFSQLSEVKVEYAYLNTPDVIAPANALLIYDGSGGGSGPTYDEGLQNDVVHKKGYQLTARYLDIDYGSPYLAGLIREAETAGLDESLSYEDACSYFMKLYGVDLGYFLTKDEYEKAAEQTYSAADLSTDGVSAALQELAAKVTSDVPGEYDKCRVVESYLRQYSYQTDAVGGHDPLSTMSTPAGMADIADRFLFETGAGYCVHYTSSMVMLLRLSGIPARAVSGYRYVYPFEKADAYEVSGDCAHIWPEAYIQGVGWVPFEPTSAYRTAEEYTWHRKPAAAGNDSQSAYVPPVPAPAQVPDVPDNEKSSGSLSGMTLDQAMRIALPTALSILVTLALLILGTLSAARLRYLRAAPEKKLAMDVDMIKKGIRRQSAEVFTDRGLLSDYIARAPEALRPDIQRVFDIYYRVLYESSAVSAEENELAASVREQLHAAAKKRLKK